MRCYHINNFYLSGIHAGIQSAHAQHELAIKYLDNAAQTISEARTQYLDWAKHHKTIVVLNGGMQSDLMSFRDLLEVPENPYAWLDFYESEEALNGALTNLAVVLPEHMYAHTGLIMAFLEKTRATEALNNSSMNFTGRDGEDIEVKQYGEGLILLRLGQSYQYTAFDIGLMKRLSACRLM